MEKRPIIFHEDASDYVTPEITVLEIVAEKGIATSGQNEDMPDDEIQNPWLY